MFYNKEIYISTEYCDTTVKLGGYRFFYLLQNAMIDGFEVSDCGNTGLKNKCNGYWAVTKTKLEVFEQPSYGESVKVKADYSDDGRLRVYVNTEILSSSGRLLAKGCQELCILDLTSHRPKRLIDTSLILKGLNVVKILEFEKFVIDGDVKREYELTVLSQHIDMSHHVNNIEYIRMAEDLFSINELENRFIGKMEVHYINECREGDILLCRRIDNENCSMVRITNGDKVAFEMKFEFK
ncbi:MAG: hypothetical protein E7568_06530 [Ruminococcaceae bacterium]|nr:hypothetical protein [Oscillospiraceae bacterium]